MGDYGLAHEVGTLFGYTDNLHSIRILQVTHMRDCPVTWSASLYSIGPGSQVYSLFFGELPASHGDTVDVEHYFSSPDRRSVKEVHPNVRGHATGMCLDS